MQSNLAMHHCQKCHAKTRAGTKCQSPAMKNGRCRMHGGKSTGAPKGNQNALKHGFYSADMIEEMRFLRKILKDTKLPCL